MVVDLIKGGDKQPSAGRAALCRKLFGFFFWSRVIERAPTQVPLVDSLVGIIMCIVL